jgi:AraC-like DNA-binding protein
MPIYTSQSLTYSANKVEDHIKISSTNKEISEISLSHNDPFLELVDKINTYLIEEEPYINPDFTINELSASLKVPVHHVSYCLNTLMNVKFTSLRTQLRIQYATKLLDSGQADELSMDGIGKKSGFSTRSNFYNAFKTETGMTPSEYLDRKN